jgi:hypothetical protein
MPKLTVACAGAVVVFVALIVGPALKPDHVFAATAVVSAETPLLEAPAADAVVLTPLPAGTAVSLDGPPVDGYFPVTVWDLAGWVRGDALSFEDKAAAAPGAATPIAGAPAEAPTSTDSAVAAPPADAVDPASAFPDAGPTGPATVTAKAPILLGPGPDFGLIATAPKGSTVEQTGHLIDGYVTVRYAEVTGWAPLDHLGPPGALGVPTEPEETGEPADVKAKKKRR